MTGSCLSLTRNQNEATYNNSWKKYVLVIKEAILALIMHNKSQNGGNFMLLQINLQNRYNISDMHAMDEILKQTT